MPTLTALGRKAAVAGLTRRREAAKTQTLIRNQDLYAGSPMYFCCLGCGLQNIVVPEGWLTKPDLCDECTALKSVGWLE
jgi:hypothetical protein